MKKTLRFARNGLVAFGLLFIFVTVTPLVSWWTRRLAGPWDDPRGDILIILGGSMLEDGTLGTSSYWRALYGVRVWRQDHFREIFISGGTEANPVAGHMRDFMVFLGVPASIVRIEAESRSTRENALFAQKLLAESPGRKVLLTSDYHMFRAYRAFRRAGVDCLPRPFPDAIKQSGCYQCRWSVFVELCTESVKIVYYWSRGWI